MKNHTTFNRVFNTPRRPQTKDQWGHFLAGLIDADGHINTAPYISITFHSRDYSVACIIKRLLQGGRIYKYKKSKCCRYNTTLRSLSLLAHLITNRLKVMYKIDVFNKAVVPIVHCNPCASYTCVSKSNHWLAGFVQGDGCFYIKILEPLKPGRAHRVSIVLSITQKDDVLLRRIQAEFGGFVNFNKQRKIYMYSSTSLANASRFVSYFDKFQVVGSSFRLYLCWRRVYHLMFDKKHLTPDGLAEIKSLKLLMTQLRS